jgi:hypothetical protein
LPADFFAAFLLAFLAVFFAAFLAFFLAAIVGLPVALHHQNETLLRNRMLFPNHVIAMRARDALFYSAQSTTDNLTSTQEWRGASRSITITKKCAPIPSLVCEYLIHVRAVHGSSSTPAR